MTRLRSLDWLSTFGIGFCAGAAAIAAAAGWHDVVIGAVLAGVVVALTDTEDTNS